MSEVYSAEALISIAKDYFRRGDAGSDTLADLFTEDVQLYFPKFGIGRGKAALADLATGLMGILESIAHTPDDYLYIASGRRLAVEGTTRGQTRSGKAWAGGETPGGRFCSIFEFEGPLISRMHIYLDPDYVSECEARFHWGSEGRKW